MKKINSLLAIIIIISMIGMTACNSENQYKRNPDYTYGTIEKDDDIEAVYNLVGEPENSVLDDYTDGVSKGKRGSYHIKVCETGDGGVVAYGEGKYVYSSDKNDKNDVRNALFLECSSENEKD